MFSQQQNLQYFYPIHPNNQRKQTDFCCIIPYSALSMIVILTFFYSFILEKDKNLFTPQDPSGHHCGVNQAQNYPYIYFPSPFPESLNKAVCVKHCPNSTDERQLNCLHNVAVSDCRYNATDHFNRSNQFLIYPTKSNSFLSFCQPESQALMTIINSKVNTEHLLTNIYYIYTARDIILFVCPGTCFLLMLLYLLLINTCPNMKPIFIGMIISFFLLIGYLTIFLFLQDTRRFFPYSPILGIVVGIGLICLLAFAISQRNYFLRGLDLVDISTHYIKDNCRIVLVPMAMFIFWVLFFSLQLSVFIFIYCIDTSNQQKKSEYSFPYLLNIQHDPFVIALMIITLIHFIWTNLIIQHMGKFVSRVGAANWIMHVPKHFKNALFSMFRFHLGSVIAGSIVITLFSWVSDFFYFIMPDSNNRLCCCTLPGLGRLYQTQFFRKHLGHFSELTYIKIGLDGQSFRTSGYNITPLIINNTKYVNQAYKMAKRIVQISQLLVAVLTTIICYLVIEISESMEAHILTNIIIFLISLLLTSFGFDAYDKAFQVILFAVIINKTQKIDPIERVGFSHFAGLSNQQDDSRMKVYRQISKWFNEGKFAHLADQQANPSPVLEQNLN